MSNVIAQIEQQIAKLSSKAVKKNTGTIRSVADGVAKLDGLSDVMYNEMVQFPGGAIGIALNLEEDEVGCVVLGDISKLKEGDEVQTTGRLLSVPVGKALLGRTVDALGNPVDGKGPIAAKESYPVEKIAPGIIVRKSVSQPLFTGIMAIDSMIPIGRGQRELIIGDRGTGKTTIAIDTIINQAKINKVGLASGDPKFRPVYSIYVAVGQKNSNIVRTIAALEAAGVSATPMPASTHAVSAARARRPRHQMEVVTAMTWASPRADPRSEVMARPSTTAAATWRRCRESSENGKHSVSRARIASPVPRAACRLPTAPSLSAGSRSPRCPR